MYPKNRNLEERKLDFESGSTHLPNPTSHAPKQRIPVCGLVDDGPGFLTFNGSGPFEYSHVYELHRHKPIENFFGRVRIGVFWRIVIEVREPALSKKSVFVGSSARNDL